MNTPNVSVLEDVMKSAHVANSVTILIECFQKFQLNEIFVCFNGGKDCTVLLFLVLNVIRRVNSEFSGPITCMYARTNEPFVEVENFIDTCRNLYNLNIITYSGGVKESLRQMLSNNRGLKACLAGTKRTDPFSENLRYFQVSFWNFLSHFLLNFRICLEYGRRLAICSTNKPHFRLELRTNLGFFVKIKNPLLWSVW